MSLDGTLIRAHASKDKNLTCPRAQPLRLPLPQEVQALLVQAEQADPREEDSQRLPEELARRQALRKKMEEACARREARAQARAEAEKAQARRPQAQPQPREGHAQGPSSKPPPAAPAPEAQVHLTDPDLRLMRKNRRESYSQGYNAQVVVDAEGSPWIVGQRVSDSATDAGHWEPGLQSIPQELGQPTAVLADCGYGSKEDFQRLGRQRPGLALYGSVHRAEAHAPRRYDDRPLDKVRSPRRLRDPVWVAMAEKLKTPEGRALDRRRLCTVEPAFGVIQAVLGFGPFLVRGLQKVRGEWALVCLAYNGKRLHRLEAGLGLAGADSTLGLWLSRGSVSQPVLPCGSGPPVPEIG